MFQKHIAGGIYRFIGCRLRIVGRNRRWRHERRGLFGKHIHTVQARLHGANSGCGPKYISVSNCTCDIDARDQSYVKLGSRPSSVCCSKCGFQTALVARIVSPSTKPSQNFQRVVGRKSKSRIVLYGYLQIRTFGNTDTELLQEMTGALAYATVSLAMATRG